MIQMTLRKMRCSKTLAFITIKHAEVIMKLSKIKLAIIGVEIG
jgi:hypothetical protein